MDDLTRYVINHYRHLMTPREFQGYRAVIGREKMAASDNPNMRTALEKFFVPDDPEILAQLADGNDAFLLRIRDRILREHPDGVFLNCCPRCGALARTPRARQCPKCLTTW